jgi:FkbM family methyltransferase
VTAVPTDPSQTLVTYAQNREDLYLWALVGHRTPGFYVDVGCNHERLHSVTRLFYEHGWSGINIDANARFEPEYLWRTRDTFVASGVGEAAGELVFRDYPQHDGLSTFDATIKQMHDGAGYPHRDLRMRIRTLDSILDEARSPAPDFLKIDVEGLEPEVLRGFDFGRFRPAVIVIEASRQASCSELLLPLGYRIEFFDGLNVYYVDDAAADVSIHNYAGRVLQPGFVTDAERQLREQLLLERSRRRSATSQAGEHADRVRRGLGGVLRTSAARAISEARRLAQRATRGR